MDGKGTESFFLDFFGGGLCPAVLLPAYEDDDELNQALHTTFDALIRHFDSVFVA